MSRSLALFAIGLIFGGGVGFVIAAGSGSTFDSHDHADPSQHGSNAEMAAHDHSAVTNLPADSNAPSVAIKMIKDPMAGWNLHVTPQNFRFSPENASTEEILGDMWRRVLRFCVTFAARMLSAARAGISGTPRTTTAEMLSPPPRSLAMRTSLSGSLGRSGSESSETIS